MKCVPLLLLGREDLFQGQVNLVVALEKVKVMLGRNFATLKERYAEANNYGNPPLTVEQRICFVNIKMARLEGTLLKRC